MGCAFWSLLDCRCIYRVVVIIGLPQVRALPVDSMAGAGGREGGEGVLGAAGGQSVRRASRTVLSQGRPCDTGAKHMHTRGVQGKLFWCGAWVLIPFWTGNVKKMHVYCGSARIPLTLC